MEAAIREVEIVGKMLIDAASAVCILISDSWCISILNFFIISRAEPPPGLEFLSFSLYIADFLSHLGKWVRLIKFKAEYEHFYTREVSQM